MTPQEIDVVQRSFDKVALEKDRFASDFYDRLFAQDPGLRRLFPADMTQMRGKLTSMLVVVVCNLRTPDALRGPLERLGERHHGYKVKRQDYAAAQTALLGALAHNLGEEWTPGLQQAWIQAYEMLSGMMQPAAA